MATVSVQLPFPPSVNNLFRTFIRPGQKFGRRVPTPKYNQWKGIAGLALRQQAPRSITGPITISFIFQRPDRRKRDIFNLVKALEDLLVTHKVIEDDSLVEDGHVTWGKVNGGGVRIEIDPFSP
jgi:crossover junction endodeoxyribonuclease RusA